MSNIVIDIVTQFTGKKAFKDADSAAQKLTGSVKRLGAAFGVSLGAAAIVRFGRASVTAFAEAEKANTRLANSVKNLGLSLSTADIQKNLDEISAKTGIAGEPLAAAYQSLLTTTGSVIKSQELFNQALDISQGSGVELSTVTDDLSKAYVGITRGLTKYKLGLTQTELKTKTFAELQVLLNKQFAGSNAQYLETYAGKMGVLGEAAGNAQEILGGGIINSLMIISKNTSIEDLADDMARLAENTANALQEMSRWGGGVFSVFDYGAGVLERFIKATQPFADLIFEGDPTGFLNKPRPTARRFFTGGQDSVKAGQAAAAERLAKKRADDLLKLQKASLKVQQDALKLKKAGTLFDVEQAGIIAALQNQTSKEDEIRLKLQFAILTGNVSEATKLAGEVAKAQGLTKELVAYYSGIPNAKNPFAGWITTLTEAEAIQKRLLATSPKTPTTPLIPDMPATPAVQSILDILTGISMTQGPSGDMSDYLYANGPKSGQPIVNVKVTLDGKEMAGAITDIQTNNSLSGSQITLQRTLGQFE